MANYWSAKGWEIVILTTWAGDQSYGLHADVTHFDLGSPRFDTLPTDSHVLAPLDRLIDSCSQAERAVLIPQVTHILKLREALFSTRPGVVISYMAHTNILVLSGTRGSGLPVIVTEHCDPNDDFIGEGWEPLRRRLYRKRVL
jgi:hypothetical protein